MKSLLLVEAKVNPKMRGVFDDVLRKAKDAIDIELVDYCIIQFRLGHRDLVTKKVTLSLVGCPINRPFMKIRIVDAVKTLSLFSNDLFQASSQFLSIGVFRSPDIQNDRTEQLHIPRLADPIEQGVRARGGSRASSILEQVGP